MKSKKYILCFLLILETLQIAPAFASLQENLDKSNTEVLIKPSRAFTKKISEAGFANSREFLEEYIGTSLELSWAIGALSQIQESYKEPIQRVEKHAGRYQNYYQSVQDHFESKPDKYYSDLNNLNDNSANDFFQMSQKFELLKSSSQKTSAAIESLDIVDTKITPTNNWADVQSIFAVTPPLVLAIDGQPAPQHIANFKFREGYVTPKAIQESLLNTYEESFPGWLQNKKHSSAAWSRFILSRLRGRLEFIEKLEKLDLDNLKEKHDLLPGLKESLPQIKTAYQNLITAYELLLPPSDSSEATKNMRSTFAFDIFDPAQRKKAKDDFTKQATDIQGRQDNQSELILTNLSYPVLSQIEFYNQLNSALIPNISAQSRLNITEEQALAIANNSRDQSTQLLPYMRFLNSEDQTNLQNLRTNLQTNIHKFEEDYQNRYLNPDSEWRKLFEKRVENTALTIKAQHNLDQSEAKFSQYYYKWFIRLYQEVTQKRYETARQLLLEMEHNIQTLSNVGIEKLGAHTLELIQESQSLIKDTKAYIGFRDEEESTFEIKEETKKFLNALEANDRDCPFTESQMTSLRQRLSTETHFKNLTAAERLQIENDHRRLKQELQQIFIEEGKRNED